MANDILHSPDYTCSWCGATDSCPYLGAGRAGRFCNKCGQSFLIGSAEAKLAATVKRLEEIRAEAHAILGDDEWHRADWKRAMLNVEGWAEAALRAAREENGKL